MVGSSCASARGRSARVYRRVVVLVASMAVVALVVGVQTAAAQSPPPPTLTGETLDGVATISPHTCSPTTGGSFTYSVSGVAIGPYPGTFTETGTVTYAAPVAGVERVTLSATFTITSGTTTITGTKHNGVNAVTGQSTAFGFCATNYFNDFLARYSALIDTPTGTFYDEGRTIVSNYPTEPPGFTEVFISTLVTPLPTSKEQCKDGGWMTFGGAFKNQGDCVSFVSSKGKNEADG